ncbi:(R)-specific enoyl-CoA hydratase RipB/Ich [Paraburkholderia strydomiana]|uniref:(R)-specific enoyl-CoA hydratase RipB/Ich n=1 Tax=Paraburkholderia strydomiana TaxID=1245417 RepID=UPI002864DB03|nr:(R)-specific enoyl-CoA hydratase RipB/Ich [Paraburkholderia strydomiana]MDR7009320.1 itaconyl-CoA hydratase [Paraburkholderia strydomiana]
MDNILPAYKRVGDQRYRETSGLYYEDFNPGDTFEHRPGRTVLDTDNVWFTLLTLNIQQVHFDAAYAAKTEWKKLLVDSTFTLALLTGMSVRTVSAKVVANLGWDKVKASHPVFAGDTLYAESTVLHKRESRSRPTQGIVTVLTRGINQNGDEVMSFERTMLVYRRGHSPEEASNY